MPKIDSSLFPVFNPYPVLKLFDLENMILPKKINSITQDKNYPASMVFQKSCKRKNIDYQKDKDSQGN